MKTMLFFLKKIRTVHFRIYVVLMSFQILGVYGQNNASIPQVASGVLVRWENFNSRYIGQRNVDIWRPYVIDDTVIAYTVLYMHDGQMLFDSTITWNHQEWQVDETLQTLINQGKVPPTMVVAIHNGGSQRHSEYFPQKVYENMDTNDLIWCRAHGNIHTVGGDSFRANSDNYLRFIVKELKPAIDSSFFVKKDKAHTFIGGSSMGGLISMYAMCEYPTIFGGAMCFSTHWPGVYEAEGNPVPDLFLEYLNLNMPPANSHKWYFDLGDQTLDALYPKLQSKVDSLMRLKGNNEKNWITRFFGGHDHSERSWSRRFGDAYWWMNAENW